MKRNNSSVPSARQCAIMTADPPIGWEKMTIEEFWALKKNDPIGTLDVNDQSWQVEIVTGRFIKHIRRSQLTGQRCIGGQFKLDSHDATRVASPHAFCKREQVTRGTIGDRDDYDR